MLVLGNSIAAGLGLADPGRQSFPARLQQKVDSLGWNVRVRNAGESGMTSAGGLQRIDWLLQQPVDVLVLELGGNDGLRGVDPTATTKNLTAIIDSTFSRYPDARVILAGMQIPPNLGPQYTQRFRDIYPSIASQYDRVSLIPFVLEGVGGVDSLMQDDGIHPTIEGQRYVASNVWNVLRPVLENMQTRDSELQPAS
ncbi:arylesterase [Longibacter salinarum]|uniref:arylesterase n=1 Tax=Longibacter salinarum TaxID=1850348 RepID=UPI001FE35D90|nr:arylesterase [Longibacter salinarum]